MSADTNPNLYFQPNDEECKLWRYMNFSKFISLISSNSLHFARVDKFLDKFEGSFPIENIKQREINYDEKTNKNLTILTPILKYFTFINCWHMSEHESAAMWELYGSNEGAIAIESNYITLKRSLPFNISMSCVKYIDYQSDLISEKNIHDPYIYKRKSFEHEKEVRLIMQSELEIDVYMLGFFKNKIDGPGKKMNINSWLNDSIPKIKKVDVNLNSLITTIHVSPFVPTWFFELVKKVVQEDYKLNIEVKQSDLYKDPIY